MKNNYRFILEPYKGPRTRHKCPNCLKEKQFTRYIDVEKNCQISDHVGRCNRENNCGYHYTPGDFFKDNPDAKNDLRNDGDWLNSDAWKTTFEPPAPTPVDYLPIDVMKATFRSYGENNFIRFLSGFFGPGDALELARIYNLGTSKKYLNHGGKAVVFWQVDINGNIRQAKIMAYHPDTGKRIKEDGRNYISFAGKAILKNKGANLQQCFFGEHLISDRPTDKVAIVESEKTAVIMAGIYPEVVWIATGGKNGARWTDEQVFRALTDRDVIIYPDLGATQDWAEKAKILGTVCDYKVSDLLEQSAAGQDWAKGYDIADYFLNRNQTTIPAGWKYKAVNGGKTLEDEDEIPAIWKLRTANGNQVQAIQDEEKRLGII